MTESKSVRFIEQAALGVENALEKRKGLYLAAATILCAVTFSGYSHAKVAWMDETLTITIARQAGLSGIWRALRAGFEADPPFLETIVHFLFRFFGDHIFLARLPAILGFCLTCACLAALVWRHSGALFGAAAFLFSYATGLRVRAMDARPYGMMIGFSALALLAWDRLGDETGKHRGRWRAVFTLSLAAALFSHFFSIWIFAGLGLGELYRWWLRRKIDWATPVCAAVAMIPFALSLPVVIGENRLFEVKQGHFHGHVAIKDLFDFFGQQVATLPAAMAVALLLLGFAVWGERELAAKWGPAPLRVRELLAASAGLLLTPVAGFAAALLVTKFFVGYYFLIVGVGLAVGVSLALAALPAPANRVAGLCLFLALLGQGAFVTARGLSGFVRRDPGYPSLASIWKLTGTPGADLVVTAPAEFLPFYEATRSPNLTYLFDGDKSLQQTGQNTSEVIYRQLQPFTQAHIDAYDAYVSGHASYYAVVFDHGTGLDDWLFDYWLTRGHARLTWLGNVDAAEVYRVEPNR